MSETVFYLILTTDYELFGDGSGRVDQEMLEPTERLIEVAEEHSCPVTLFLEMAELLAFRNSANWVSWSQRIEEQISNVLSRGHDVQLHFHPQWIGATIGPNGIWLLDDDQYDLGLLLSREQNTTFIIQTLRQCKSELEHLCRRTDPSYKCIAFRSGRWAIRPEANVLRILSESGIYIDSSALPGMYLKNSDRVYDFRDLPMDMPAWLVSRDLAQPDYQHGTIWEMPVLTERISIQKVLQKALSRAIVFSGGTIEGKVGKHITWSNFVRSFLRLIELVRSPVVRFDYCLQDAHEMIRSVNAAKERFSNCGMSAVPLVMAGHTKTQRSLRHLDCFLDWAQGELRFGTFAECLKMNSYKSEDNG